MRIKEFIIFIFIFTILYILFFVIYDYIHNKILDKKNKDKLNSLINIDKYLIFTRFYGIESNVSKEIIINIYDEIKTLSQFYISFYANKYNITNIELVVIVLYLEYLELLGSKNISIQNNFITKASINEENMIFKYKDSFKNKIDINTMITSFGNNVVDDLVYLDKFFLIPGVRFINSIIYYVGD